MSDHGGYIEILEMRGDYFLKTNVGAGGRTWRDTRAMFENARQLEVPMSRAEFTLDLHRSNHDLIDSFPIDSDGFRAITGQEPPTHDEAKRIEAEYWSTR